MRLKSFLTQPKDSFDPVCISCTRPENDSALIAFSDHWRLMLHPNQCGLANCLMVARRHVPKISMLSEDEMMDFHSVFALVEPALEESFGARLVNISCARNFAFRKDRPDPPFRDGQPNPHVHWHIMPRYDRKVIFEGIEWVDETFGDGFVWKKKPIPQEVRHAIIGVIRSKLPVIYNDPA